MQEGSTTPNGRSSRSPSTDRIEGSFSVEKGATVQSPVNKYAPLSFSQQGLWIFDQLNPLQATYNVASAVHLKGPLQICALAEALSTLVRRHESLRTRISIVDGVAQQIVDAAWEISLVPVEVSGLSRVGDLQLLKWLEVEAAKPFDLRAGPLFRPTLFRLESDEYVLLLAAHHMVLDGWSIGIMNREISAVYNAYLLGVDAELVPLPVNYREFAASQHDEFRGDARARLLEYWTPRLQPTSVLELPADRQRPNTESHRGARVQVVMPPNIVERLRALSRNQGVTLFMVLLAAFQLMLGRYARQEKFSVGTVVANRTRAEAQNIVGFTANTLVLPVNLEGDPNFLELLKRVRTEALGAYAHQAMPFGKLVEVLRPERDLSRHPLFQAMFTLQNAPVAPLNLHDISASLLQVGSGTAKFDVDLFLIQNGAGLTGYLEYAKDLFDVATIERFVANYHVLLEGIIADPTRRLSELPLQSEEERQRVLQEWNPTGVLFSDFRCIHEWFEAQVERAPEAIALTFEDRSVTYSELNAQSNRLAHYLRGLGVGPEARVAVCLARSLELVVGLLAVLKTGGAYVPLDPSYPIGRLTYMLQDSTPVVLLAHEATHLSLRDALDSNTRGICQVDMDTCAENWAGLSTQNITPDDIELTPKNLAYVIYTSGSTGTPKGVMVEHGQVIDLFKSTEQGFNFGPDDVWTLFHSVAFDFSVWEIWGALMYGGRLVVVSQLTARTPEEFYQLLCTERVTVLNQTPGAFRQLIAAQKACPQAHCLRYVVFGGEALDFAMLSPWRQDGRNTDATLVNMYGITEITVHATYLDVTRDEGNCNAPGSSIGRPLPNTQIYILDGHLRPVPIGVTGEIFVGGGGVVRGYMNRETLTAERFMPNPFSETDRLYRTGDLGRYLTDGNIMFLGRNDFQVKIRGFRIECGEIEVLLAQHEDVSDAIVLARKDKHGESRLVGYVIATQGCNVDPAKLRHHLARLLPDHMVPVAIVTVDAFPLTPNGKLDRSALPTPNADSYGMQVYEAPFGRIETELAAIWGDILGVERVGRHDHFFELGGHSLLAMRVLDRMRQSGLEVDIRQLFLTPILADLAAFTVEVIEVSI